jgi:hypothetical protein
MYPPTTQSLQAEISYRQERIKRDYENANSLLRFLRRPAKAVTPTSRVQAVRTRTAM